MQVCTALQTDNHASTPPLSFLQAKIPHFNGRSAVRGTYASPCQISSKSVKRLQRYDDLIIFKMAAMRHLGVLKFKYFNGRAIKRPILLHLTKFHICITAEQAALVWAYAAKRR